MTYEQTPFRIVRTNKGFRIDIQKYKWTLFGIKKYWVHYISYAGLPDKAYHFKTFNDALTDLTFEITQEVNENF
jgi:hypothetical protein